VPELLEGVPYAPYTKGDKVGRISDFTQSGFNKYGSARRPEPTSRRLRRCIPEGRRCNRLCSRWRVSLRSPRAGRFQSNQVPGVAVFNFFHNEEARPCSPR